jgi:hypothetical protein
MEPEYLTLFKRAVDALERIADNLDRDGHHETPSVREPQSERTRDILMSKFEGLYITIEQAREALAMHDASAKAVGQVVAAAGFEKRRWASGIKFAICKPGGQCQGSPVVLPDNLDEAAAAARIGSRKSGRATDARGLLYGAYLMQGVTAKPSQVTRAHIEEAHKLFPEFPMPEEMAAH